jgi:hypothetical protein
LETLHKYVYERLVATGTWKGLEVKFLKKKFSKGRTFLLKKKKNVISTFDVTTYQTGGGAAAALLLFLQEMKTSFIDKGPGLVV